MMTICKGAKSEFDLKLSHKDLNHKGITAAKFYLRKVVEVGTEPFGLIEWKRIREYNQIRNLIVHCNSELSPDNDSRSKAVRKYAATKDSKMAITGDNFALDAGFCERAIDDVEKFFEALFNSIRARQPSPK